MKTHKVYELINLYGTVEYVGETTNPKMRMYQHTKVSPGADTGAGKFYKRSDLIMHIVSEFEDRLEALAFEGQLKKDHGFEWTERIRNINQGAKNGKVSGNAINTCVICGRSDLKGNGALNSHTRKCKNINKQ